MFSNLHCVLVYMCNIYIYIYIYIYVIYIIYTYIYVIYIILYIVYKHKYIIHLCTNENVKLANKMLKIRKRITKSFALCRRRTEGP